MSFPFQFEKPVRSIAIIGAGPSGLAVAHALLEEPSPGFSDADSSSSVKSEPYFRVTLFERQATIGGVWNYIPDLKPAPDGYPKNQIPETNPLLVTSFGDKDWYNAMYRDLETNIPIDVMAFANKPFPASTDFFPSRPKVCDYVRAYGKDVEPLVRLRTEVTNAHKDGSNWVVTYKRLDKNNGDNSATECFDALVLATGHYDTPYIPDVPGLQEFVAAHPGVIAHAKAFSTPEAYAGKRVLIVGNSASGFDIASEIAGGGAQKVYRSSREKTAKADKSLQDPRIDDRPLISAYSAKEGEIVFTDETVLTLDRDLDYVLYCTGYLYAFPFLRSYIGDSPTTSDNEKSDDNLVQYHPEAKTSNRLYRLYNQLLYYPDPTLSTIVMTKQTVPFPLAESQGAVLARVYSGRLTLPSVDAMRAAEQKREQQVIEENSGNIKAADSQAFHSFAFPRDVEYYRLLQAWLDKVTDRPSQGFHPLVWDDAKYELRQRASRLKNDRIKARLDKVRKDLEKQ